jgi:hypothetical protein
LFDRLVEKKIREALEAGEFDGLEGAGRPVNLDAYFATPEELRAGYAVLKNAGVVPEEARERLRQSVADLTLKYDLLVEHYRGQRRSG